MSAFAKGLRMRRYATALICVVVALGCADDSEPTATGASPETAADENASAPTPVSDAATPLAPAKASGEVLLDAGPRAEMDAGSGSTLHDAATSHQSPADDATVVVDASAVEPGDASAIDARTDSGGASDDASSDGGELADAQSPPATSDALIAHLRQCKLVGDGMFSQRPVLDAYDRCAAGCLLNASCQAVIATECTAVADLDLQICQAKCTQLTVDDGFRCGATVIPHAWLCDTHKDCSDGSDEVNCGTFTCTDGAALASASLHCDGLPDCKDGSDEVGCASYCATLP